MTLKRTVRKKSPKERNLENALLDDFGWFVTHYSWLRDTAAEMGLSFRNLITGAVRKFRHEFEPTPASADEEFWVEKAGAHSYEDARILYRRLSRFFAHKGASKTSAADFRKRGAKGAAKRWGKKK